MPTPKHTETDAVTRRIAKKRLADTQPEKPKKDEEEDLSVEIMVPMG